MFLSIPLRTRIEPSLAHIQQMQGKYLTIYAAR